MDKDAYWFSHDSNAKDDPKCIILIEELGLEGYGIFWVLIETLRDQKDFKAPLRIIPAIARRYNTSSEKIKAVISRYELFQVENEEFFFSPSLISRMQNLLHKKHEKRIGGIKGNLIKYGHASKEQLDKLTDDEILRLNEHKTGFSHTDHSPIALKERRVKDSKGEESKDTCYDFDDFWDDYGKKKDKKKSVAKWKRINESDREKIKEFIPVYKRYEPNPDYRKNPTTFLNSEIWNDDWSAYPPKQERNNQNHGNNTARTKGDEHVEFLTRHMR